MVANRDCKICLKYDFDESTGQMTRGRDGRPELRLVDCGAAFHAPCRNPAKGCPKGSPEHPKSLIAENELCLAHFLECEAIGRFPEDGVVARNAAEIRAVRDLVRKTQETEYRGTVIRLLRDLGDAQCQMPPEI